MKPTDPKIQRWREYLRVIRQDTVALVYNRRLFREIMKLIQSNPRLPETSAVYGWMMHAYMVLATSAVRRQVDKGGKVISLIRLLEEMLASPESMTRAWFLSQYQHVPASASGDFDRFDPTGTGFVDPEVIRDDLSHFEAEAKATEIFAHNYVAHRNEKIALKKAASPPTLTWGELDRAIDLLGALLQKYELLLEQEPANVEVPIGEDWRRVFRQPWIPQGSGEDPYGAHNETIT
jgi:hypothetical protein